ncbi:MAG: hypothetical protein LBM70_08260 [Victivallales bacterium]|jgi:hypothetical protein|nr:hypothetical protein [Victivallales bacterium]
MVIATASPHVKESFAAWYPKIQTLPKNYRILLAADNQDGAGIHNGNYTNSSQLNGSIRYRHGSGDTYGHGGSAFSLLYSDGSVVAYSKPTVQNYRLFR